MAIHKMTVFAKADPVIHSIFSGDAAMRMLSAQAPGEDTFLCGYCDGVVCEKLNPVQFQGFVYKCGICGSYNIFPQQFETARSKEVELPPRIRAVAHDLPADDLLRRLDDAISWLKGFGFNVDRTRVASYRGVLSSVIESGGNPEKKFSPSHINSFFEANEICRIYSAFSDGAYDDFLHIRFKAVCGGPVYLTDENTSSGNAARNFAFELQTAANFVLGGLSLDCDDGSDVVVSVDDRKIILECKRPHREKGCSKRIIEAGRQLNSRYKRDNAKKLRGIVALDLTRVAGVNLTSPFKYTLEEAAKMRTEYFKDFRGRYSGLFNKLSGNQTIGILLRVSLVGRLSDRGDGLMYMQDQTLSMIPNISSRDEQTFFAVAQVLRKPLSLKGDGRQLAVVEEYFGTRRDR